MGCAPEDIDLVILSSPHRRASSIKTTHSPSQICDYMLWKLSDTKTVPLKIKKEKNTDVFFKKPQHFIRLVKTLQYVTKNHKQPTTITPTPKKEKSVESNSYSLQIKILSSGIQVALYNF